jgi:hypothetical protein
MNELFKKTTILVFLLFSVFLYSCSEDNKAVSGNETEAVSNNAIDLDDETATKYKAKVQKRLSKSILNSTIRELAKVGVAEANVRCILKDHSYRELAKDKNTPEVQAVFKECDVDPDHIKDW